MSKKTEMLVQATMLFMKCGIKSLTMDDIARHLGISKKTLYQYVSDKKDLVNQCVHLAISDEECILCDVLDQKGNAIDILLDINKRVSEKVQNVQPSVMYDIERYYPDAFKIMDAHKKEFIFNMVKANMELGIKEGLYRNNLIPEVIASSYIAMTSQLFNPDPMNPPKYDFKTLHREIARYHIRGIASEKGRLYLKEKLNADIDNN
jgi:TetR/AcrR family transcriptional regulator, cholesterol catabolism regulator